MKEGRLHATIEPKLLARFKKKCIDENVYYSDKVEELITEYLKKG